MQLSKLKVDVNTPASKTKATKATKKTKDTLKRKLSAAERVHGELSDSPSSFTPPTSKNENHQKKNYFISSLEKQNASKAVEYGIGSNQ